MRSSRSRIPEKVHVMIGGVNTPLLLRAVTNSEIDALMPAFNDGDFRPDFRLLRFWIQRLDVDELKQFHAVQPPLRFLNGAPAIQFARFVEQLPADHRIRDAGIAGDFDRSEI